MLNTQHALKLTALLQAKGFQPTMTLVSVTQPDVLVKVDKHICLIVHETKVELIRRKRTATGLLVFRRCFLKEAFKPSQIVHAVVDLATQ